MIVVENYTIDVPPIGQHSHYTIYTITQCFHKSDLFWLIFVVVCSSLSTLFVSHRYLQFFVSDIHSFALFVVDLFYLKKFLHTNQTQDIAFLLCILDVILPSLLDLGCHTKHLTRYIRDVILEKYQMSHFFDLPFNFKTFFLTRISCITLLQTCLP